MTGPRTIQLTPIEWRALIVAGAQNLQMSVSQYASGQGANINTDVPTPNDCRILYDHLERLKLQVGAWAASGQQSLPADDALPWEGTANGGGEAVSSQVAMAGGEPKKRGWPAGRKRGPRKPREAAQ